MNPTCALCGEPAKGSASVTQGDQTLRLCHPDEGQDCYHLWTVYGVRPGDDIERTVTRRLVAFHNLIHDVTCGDGGKP